MNELFTKYISAFDSFNAIEIAENYTIPCAVSDADGNLVFSDSDSLIKKFSGNCDIMKSMGYVSSQFKILNEMQMGQNLTAVTIGWRIKLQESEIEFRCLYICHLAGQGWKIFSANVYQGNFSDAV